MNDRPPPTVASPCMRRCCLDDDNVCVGCGRLLEEIVRWGPAGDAERRSIVAASRLRLARRMPGRGLT